MWRTADNKFLRIYSTTIPATNRIYTLMHDPQYRLAIAWQNVGYNQPPHPSFYIGEGMKSSRTEYYDEAFGEVRWRVADVFDAEIGDHVRQVFVDEFGVAPALAATRRSQIQMAPVRQVNGEERAMRWRWRSSSRESAGGRRARRYTRPR